MRGSWVMRGAKIVLFVLMAGTVLGFVVKSLWNWLMPLLFGLHAITFWQAIGLLLLSKILLGGFHRHSWHRSAWRDRMRARWEHMTPEEREKFRDGLRSCRPAHHQTATQTNL